MPQTKGALYVENCESVFMCFYAGDTYSYFGDEEEFMKNTSLIHPLHNTTVSHNKFNGNSANMQLQSTQSDYQSMSLWIQGGLTNRVYQNWFWGHNGKEQEAADFYAPNLVEFLPPKYFEYGHAPII